MHSREIEPEHLHQLQPLSFQRLALDLLALDLRARVTPFDLGYGRKDGGFDGRIDDGSIDGVAAPMRVEVKRVGDAAAAQRELRDFLKLHHDLPVLFVTSACLSNDDRNAMKELGARRGVEILLRDGGQLAALARAHPWLVRWYLRDGAPELRPVSDGPPDGVRDGRPLPVEVAASERIVGALAGAPLVVVHGGPRTRPDLVATRAGQAWGAAAWVVAEIPEGRRQAVRHDLGAEPARVLLIARAAHAVNLVGSRDLKDIPLVVVLDDGSAPGEWRGRARGRRFHEVEITRPTLQEVLEWAKGLGISDPWGAALQVTRPDLIESGVSSDPDQLTQAILDEAPAEAMWICAACTLLSEPDTALAARMLGAGPQVPTSEVQAWLELDALAVQTALRSGLVEGDTRLQAVSPAVGLAAVLAWVEREGAPGLARRIVALWALDPEAAHRALRTLTRRSPALGWPGLERLDEVVDAALEQLGEAARVVLALRDAHHQGRSPFSVSERHAAWLVELTRQGLAAGRPEILREAVRLAPRAVLAARGWPEVAVEAVGVLARALEADVEGLRTDAQAKEVAAPLVAPGQVEPGLAADVLAAIHKLLIRERSVGAVRLAAAAVPPWLSTLYRTGHMEGSTWVDTTRPIPSTEGRWPLAHAQVRAILLALLQADEPRALVAGFVLLRETHGGHNEAVLGHVDAALDLLETRLRAELPPIMRALAEQALWRLALDSVLSRVAVRALSFIQGAPSTRMIADLLVLGHPGDVRVATQAAERGDLTAMRNALLAFGRGEARREEQVDLWLAERPAEPHEARIQELLGLLARSMAWCDEAGAACAPSAGPLISLARRVPGPFLALLTSPGWREVPARLRPVLATVLAVIAPEAIRAAVSRREAAGGLLGEVVRFVATPARFGPEVGATWVDLLERALSPGEAMAMLHHLAVRGPPALRPRLVRWLGDRMVRGAPPDPRDGLAVTRALLVGDDAWELLRQLLSWRDATAMTTHHPWLAEVITETALRLFSGLEVEGPHLDTGRDPDGWAWMHIAEVHPERWWQLRALHFAVHPTAAIPATTARHLLALFPSDLAEPLLVWRPAPAQVLRRNSLFLRSAFEHLAQQLVAADEAHVQAVLHNLAPDAPLRVAILIAASPLLELDAMVETLRSLEPGEAAVVGYAIASQSGVVARIGPARFLHGLETDSFEPRGLIHQADELDARAEQQPARLAELLYGMASLMRNPDSDAVRRLIERSNRHVEDLHRAHPP